MSQSPDSPESEKLRVLVVDDEPTLRLGFAYALSNRNTTVETADTGRHALERIGALDFDIMVLDLRMPEMDGIGVIETLRGDQNDIPIILCSAMLSPNAALRAIRQGVVDFLLKPVRPVDLRQAIEFVIHPEDGPLSRALKAVRDKCPDEAIRILERASAPDRQTACWLKILKSIQCSSSETDVSELEDQIGKNLADLAFNAPAA